MDKVYIAGVGMTEFGRHLNRTLVDLLDQSVREALLDAGATRNDLQVVYHASATQGFLQGQGMIAGQVGLSRIGIVSVPIFNVENACASSSSAFHLAVHAVGAGVHDIALAVGVEKMNVESRARTMAVFDGAWDVTTPELNAARLMALGAGVDEPPGSESSRPYSLFMKVYAAFGRDHMRRHGTTQRQIAAIAAKNHRHSEYNPKSQYRKPFSVEEILAAPPITFPLTLPMCAPISDGAAAAVVCNSEGLRRLKGNRSRSIVVRASVVASGNPERAADEPQKHVVRGAAQRAYEKAGVSPSDIDVCELHDATAIGELLHAENLMLSPMGEAGIAAERGDFTIGGRVPINPSGGLESKGHPIGATGLGQIYELVLQLRGEAGKRQVAGARMAIHENGGGLIGIEEGVAVVNILEGRNAS